MPGRVTQRPTVVVSRDPAQHNYGIRRPLHDSRRYHGTRAAQPDLERGTASSHRPLAPTMRLASPRSLLQTYKAIATPGAAGDGWNATRAVTGHPKLRLTEERHICASLTRPETHPVEERTARERKKNPERWLSGRKRRFAKSVRGSNPSAGSNPVLSAVRSNARRKLLQRDTLPRAFFVCLSHRDKHWDKCDQEPAGQRGFQPTAIAIPDALAPLFRSRNRPPVGCRRCGRRVKGKRNLRRSNCHLPRRRHQGSGFVPSDVGCPLVVGAGTAS